MTLPGRLNGPVRGLAKGASMLAVAAMLTAGPVAAQDKDPIKMGVFLSLTGPAAAGASALKIGYDMAIAEINAAGGIAGRQIEAVYADEQGDPTVGVSEAKRLVFQEQVDVVVGNQNSQVNLAALPTFTEGKVASISDTGSALLTVDAGPYHFSNLPSTAIQGEAIANYVIDVLGVTKPALLYDDGAASKSGVEAIKAALEKRGVALAGEQQYKFHPADTTPQLLSLRRSEPDLLIFYAGSPDDVGTVQKNKIEIGWDIKELTSLVAAAVPQIAVQRAGPNAFDNTLAQTLSRFTYCASTGTGDPEVVEFIKKVQAFAPGRGADADYFNVANAYDAVYIFKQAIEATGSTEGPALAKWLETSAASVTGTISAEKLAASATNHFLVGPDSLTMVETPQERNEEGLQRRAGC
jgi:branched-chain amino acid transport system substrate-binding protein